MTSGDSTGHLPGSAISPNTGLGCLAFYLCPLLFIAPSLFSPNGRFATVFSSVSDDEGGTAILGPFGNALQLFGLFFQGKSNRGLCDQICVMKRGNLLQRSLPYSFQSGKGYAISHIRASHNHPLMTLLGAESDSMGIKSQQTLMPLLELYWTQNKSGNEPLIPLGQCWVDTVSFSSAGPISHQTTPVEAPTVDPVRDQSHESLLFSFFQIPSPILLPSTDPITATTTTPGLLPVAARRFTPPAP